MVFIELTHMQVRTMRVNDSRTRNNMTDSLYSTILMLAPCFHRLALDSASCRLHLLSVAAANHYCMIISPIIYCLFIDNEKLRHCNVSQLMISNDQISILDDAPRLNKMEGWGHHHAVVNDTTASSFTTSSDSFGGKRARKT